MSEDLAIKLNGCTTKGYVIAPAGFGKTHLIAMAVRASSGRQLILTHTFAGVNSIKTKMADLGVRASQYQVDTIASWALRLCLAYPQSSGWKIENPTSKQWNKLYECCSRLLGKRFIREAVSSSYVGLYVDEYQDCSDLQHDLVCNLAEFLPSRLLGDPLQAIFDFDDGKPVDWEASVYPEFDCLGQLEIPWRWVKAKSPELGEWLKDARRKIELGQKIDLSAHLPPSVIRVYTQPDYLAAKQYTALCGLLNHDESVIALHGGDQQSKNKTHRLANRMAGRFPQLRKSKGKNCNRSSKSSGLQRPLRLAFSML